MTKAREYFEITIQQRSKFILLLFVLFITNISVAIDITISDTIRIDGRVLVIEKEEVENLQDLPQKEFKDKNKVEQYIITDLSWGISPYGISTNISTHQQINAFIGVQDNVSPLNFTIGGRYGLRLKSNWHFETGVNLTYHAFNTTSFNIKDLLDSTINQIQNHSLVGFSTLENELYQVYHEGFDVIGYEERIEKINLQQNSNKFILLSLPLLFGKGFELSKEVTFCFKTGVLNTFILSKDFSSQYLINTSNEFQVVDDTSFRPYSTDILIEPGISITLPSKIKKIYTGIYGVIPLNSFSVNNDYYSIRKSTFGLKIGIIVNLF